MAERVFVSWQSGQRIAKETRKSERARPSDVRGPAHLRHTSLMKYVELLEDLTGSGGADAVLRYRSDGAGAWVNMPEADKFKVFLPEDDEGRSYAEGTKGLCFFVSGDWFFFIPSNCGF